MASRAVLPLPPPPWDAPRIQDTAKRVGVGLVTGWCRRQLTCFPIRIGPDGRLTWIAGVDLSGPPAWEAFPMHHRESRCRRGVVNRS